jgi:putative transcriptional regulator
MIASSNLTNQFLIAMPAMADAFFTRSVTYLCQHGENGALGIVINRPSELTLGDILEQMNIESQNEEANKIPVFFGGPVHPERGFIIHEPSSHWDSTLEVTDGLSLTTSRDILEALATGNGPEKVLIALGYAGWGKGQLEQEILHNSWLHTPLDKGVLFNLPAAQRWKAAVEGMGVNIALLSSQAGHA